ncbi:TPA: hypothetical protein ACMFQN_005246 [Pseudomonas aeruginosa]|uniref:hypothetical protein n=1 Tax=Pseudomonas aeruginosa TaxID=287 RepID=UPI002453C670|nr:hypothetical protein [Pseudomonas aeruginosa]MDH4704141.1 hypothetical protein [Pseudomonas aeruginosa]
MTDSNPDDKEYGKLHQTLCFVDRPMGAIVDLLTRGAQHCYCCSFYRGAVVGLAIGLIGGLLA